MTGRRWWFRSNGDVSIDAEFRGEIPDDNFDNFEISWWQFAVLIIMAIGLLIEDGVRWLIRRTIHGIGRRVFRRRS